MVCESQSLSYNQAADGLFKIVNFSLDMHVKAADFLLKDNSGKLVDYFRVGMELDSNPLQSATAEQCGLLNSCNTLVRGDSGQRNFARMPNGGCSWEESNWQDNTKDGSNDGAAAGLNHVRVFLNNSTAALTCSPRTVSAIACADATCSTRYGSPVSVALAPGGGRRPFLPAEPVRLLLAPPRQAVAPSPWHRAPRLPREPRDFVVIPVLSRCRVRS